MVALRTLTALVACVVALVHDASAHVQDHAVVPGRRLRAPDGAAGNSDYRSNDELRHGLHGSSDGSFHHEHRHGLHGSSDGSFHHEHRHDGSAHGERRAHVGDEGGSLRGGRRPQRPWGKHGSAANDVTQIADVGADSEYAGSLDGSRPYGGRGGGRRRRPHGRGSWDGSHSHDDGSEHGHGHGRGHGRVHGPGSLGGLQQQSDVGGNSV